MLADLSGAAKDLGARFTFGGILPFALLATYGTGLTVVALAGPSVSVLSALRTAAHTWGVAGWSALILGSVIVAMAAEPFQIGFVRLLEGYWEGIPGTMHLRQIGIELQRRRQRATYFRMLDASNRGDEARESTLRRRMTACRPRDWHETPALPTRLGNILWSTESSAGERYGLHTVVSWPRLFGVVSADLRAAVAELHSQLDGGARLAAALFLAGTASGPVLFPHAWWNLLTAGTLAAAVVSYYGALNAATRLRVIVATAFDMHRFDMLAALHLPLPDEPREEAIHNKRLSDFWLEEARTPMRKGRRYDHKRVPDAPAS